MRITAYQTLQDKGDPGEIEEHGPYKCLRQDAWLGFGYYFWDTKIEWAHWWGENSYGNEYIICQAQINIDEKCFDLVGNVSHQEDFLDAIDLLENGGWLNSQKTVTVPTVIEYLKKNNLFDFDSIRANHKSKSDYTIKFNPRTPEFTYIGQKVQVCLIRLNELVLQTFKIAFPKGYVEH